MKDSKRFRDELLTLRHFSNEVWVCCPKCGKRAIATANFEIKQARLICNSCGFNQMSDMMVSGFGEKRVHMVSAAHGYFNVELWFKVRFRDEIFWAFNAAHLEYLEKYIASGIRENKDRSGFTLVEKLPKFMQVARNREALLKLIGKLRQKEF